MWFKKIYKIEDIKNLSKSLIQTRDNYRIAIIDDQKNLPLAKSLEQHDFFVKHYLDIKSLDELIKYDIIVSDIEGVGRKFGSVYQGGHLIKEIRTRFPLKYLIAFSGKSFDMNYNQFFKLCDNVSTKNADITEWVGYLDIAINSVSDPAFMWTKARTQFLSSNIPLDLISKIEHSYVKALANKNLELFKGKKLVSKFDYGNTIATIDAIGTYIQIAISLLSKSS